MWGAPDYLVGLSTSSSFGGVPVVGLARSAGGPKVVGESLGGLRRLRRVCEGLGAVEERASVPVSMDEDWVSVHAVVSVSGGSPGEGGRGPGVPSAAGGRAVASDDG